MTLFHAPSAQGFLSLHPGIRHIIELRIAFNEKDSETPYKLCRAAHKVKNTNCCGYIHRTIRS